MCEIMVFDTYLETNRVESYDFKPGAQNEVVTDRGFVSLSENGIRLSDTSGVATTGAEAN